MRNIQRLYLPTKRAELFHCGYTVLTRFADASKLLKSVLTKVNRLALLSVKQLQTMFNLVMSWLSGGAFLYEDNSRKLRNLILNHHADKRT